MPLNWPEIAQIAAIFAGVLLLFALVGGLSARSWLRLKENKLRWEFGEQVKGFRREFEERVVGFRREAQEAVGGAIGHFMQKLSRQAVEEEGSDAHGTTSGAISLAGFKITPDLINSIAQLAQIAQHLGLIKGGGGGGAHPFLKP